MKQLKYIEVFPNVFRPVEDYTFEIPREWLNRYGRLQGMSYSMGTGKIILGVNYYSNGPNYIPKTPPFMVFGFIHDALFTLMQHRIIDFKYFDEIALYSKDILYQSLRDWLPEDVQMRKSPEIELIYKAITSQIARDWADPDKYVEPEVQVSPDPFYEIGDQE